jgi:hypothetical protein
MNKKNMRRFLIVFVMLALIPTQKVHADIGPKPTMDFSFKYETGSVMSITGGVLMECEDIACSQAFALEELGPQRFTCDTHSCSSMAYGYAEQFYIVITFSDGKTRESNLFGKEHFEAYYRVTVREDDLLVEEVGGRKNPMGYFWAGIFGGIFLIGGLVIGLVITLVMILVKGKGEESGEGVKRVWFIVAWVIGILLLLVGGMFTLAIPLTGAIELLLGWLYTLWRDRRKRVVLTMILIANVVTSLGLWTLLTDWLIDFSWTRLLIGEGIIWLVEAVILYLPLRKALRFREALLLSFVLNAVSFGVGLLLPF